MSDLTINNTVVFTAEAAKAVTAAGVKSLTFGTNPGAPFPQIGDLFSIEQLGPIVFRVAQRQLHWHNPEHLEIILVLDVPGDHIPARPMFGPTRFNEPE